MTFDVQAVKVTGIEWGWQRWFEAFSVCRNCSRSTTFVFAEKEPDVQKLCSRTQGGLLAMSDALNKYVEVKDYIGLKHFAAAAPPEHTPAPIAEIFREGATCLSVGCPNAAGTMFRLCVDLATAPLLPKEDVEGLSAKIRRELGLRLGWLFETRRLPESLRELSSCIKDDGNDAAHRGTLTKEDAEDLLDFTQILLERMFTEPKRVRLARERRDKRPKEKTPAK
jgi:hypothetical protein